MNMIYRGYHVQLKTSHGNYVDVHLYVTGLH